MFNLLTERRSATATALAVIHGACDKASTAAARRAEVTQFEGTTGDRILAFGRRYFPHYCEQEPSKLHLELCRKLGAVLDGKESAREALAAPRGHAKSTWVTLIFVLYCACYELRRFIVIISDTSAVADELLAHIKAELEENVRLARDFPHVHGVGKTWREDNVLLRNGIRILALGTGKRIRGRRFRNQRPDLMIFDDLENDDNVRNPDQRKKSWNWLMRAALKAGGQRMDAVMVGTIIHFDSVLARLTNRKNTAAAGWRKSIYRAVVSWATRTDLWDEWKRLYCDWTIEDDDRRMARADAFYQKNEAAMLEGVEVLWPERLPYLHLMKVLLAEGKTSFDSELQNTPIDPDECLFLEEWFTWFDEVQRKDGTTWLVPVIGGDRYDWENAVNLADCDCYGGVDPSMGKDANDGDPSAMVTMAAYPSARIDTKLGGYRLFFVLDADIKWRHPHVIRDQLYEMHRTRHYVRVGIETVQFQELFADEVQAGALEQVELQDLYVKAIKPTARKELRIQRLEPWVFRGQLRFNRKLTTLYDQMRYYPEADHDDGPDAVEITLKTIQDTGWTMVEPSPRGPEELGYIEEDGKMTMKPHNGYAEQLRNSEVGGRMDELPDGPAGRLTPERETCLACAHFRPKVYNDLGRCMVTTMLTSPTSVTCDEFELNPDLFAGLPKETD